MTPNNRRKLLFLIPLAVFLLLVGFFLRGLNLNPREVPSPLVGKPAPAFALPVLADVDQKFTPEEMKGQVWMLNVWASWCVSCRQEHPLLMDLAHSNKIAIYGLNYKDRLQDARMHLQRHGDPFVLTAVDADGRVGIDYGVYGTPETYVIDREGVIRYKQIGPLTPDKLEQTILPLIRELQG
ncbi:MAG: DsbE family thiol:disulfide interchange protein [Chromatiales bacterium]|jgi:cytochrome c biogenesis protein CcmG/thiol:disulfide interchange protein DsbE|nr:DsbE family thiol:disulfide interchange protein [Chromatiales bacterium]MDX9765771.1 DsbE family thiol:disulfide interchange protein [Ectothiorhodospiraceae bacterium]